MSNDVQGGNMEQAQVLERSRSTPALVLIFDGFHKAAAVDSGGNAQAGEWYHVYMSNGRYYLGAKLKGTG